jgi:hypothetical protein
MFPKILAPNRGSIGTFGGSLVVAEASTGNIFVTDSTSTTNPDAANVDVWEVNTGSGYSVQTLAAIRATAYVAGTAVRKRIYNSYFEVYSSYITQTATALDTGGLSVLTNTFNTLGAPAIVSVTQPSNGVARVIIAGSVPQDPYEFITDTVINMDQLASPFATYSTTTTGSGFVASTDVNKDMAFTISGPSGSYSGDIVAYASLYYIYPDGPTVTGPQGSNFITGTPYTKP